MPSKQAHLVPGYRVAGRYELLYPFAEGGMARVWIANILGPQGPERLVAVKTILPELAADAGFRTMFIDEAGIASRVHHPNVAEVLDAGEDRGAPYLVFEWISGDSWAKLAAAVQKAGQPFPIGALLRIAADACAGLHAAHELRDERGASREVVHRDVSPQNIIITHTGVAKVIDFGIAKAVGRLAPKTRQGLFKGKLYYASPEQLRYKGIDRRTDVWAVGAILYEYLAGRLPFARETDVATLERLLSGEPAPPLPPSVPPVVAAVVMKALAPAAEARFATALDMQRALEAAMIQPVTQADVGALVRHYLADRIEMKRRDLAEALAEVEALRGAQPGSPAAQARPAVVAPRRRGSSRALWAALAAGALVVLGVSGTITYMALGRSHGGARRGPGAAAPR
jgi:eukaryotic-like serine/threonine-protein kinase